MKAYEIAQLMAEQERLERPYHEFLRVQSMSMGLYVLPAGAVDTQQPHSEDEVYYVVEGRGMIRVDDEDRPVKAGSIIFVERGVKHYFHSIVDDLKIIVFFAPAEYSAGS